MNSSAPILLDPTNAEFAPTTERASSHRLHLDLVNDLVHLANVKTVNVHEAKTHLSRLLRQVLGGEEIVIAKGGKPVARLVPITEGRTRSLGTDRGLFQVPADFNAPLPEDVLSDFER